MFVPEFKLLRMTINHSGNKSDAYNIKQIHTQQTEWNIPKFVFPRPTGECQNAKQDVSLFDTRTRPNDMHTVA